MNTGKVLRHPKGFEVTPIDVPLNICSVIDKRCAGIRRRVMGATAFHGALDLNLLIRSTYLQGLTDGVEVFARNVQAEFMRELNG